MSVDKIKKVCDSWIGCKESDGSHKKIIDIYNNTGTLPRGYKVKYTDAWCATGVSALMITGATKKWKYKECGCENMIKLFDAQGKYTTDYKKAKVGDIIFYDWQGGGTDSDHVGFIYSEDETHWIVWECNKNDSVGFRTIVKTWSLIKGYGVIDYNNADISKKYFCERYNKYCEG